MEDTKNFIAFLEVLDKKLEHNKYHKFLGIYLLNKKETMRCLSNLKKYGWFKRLFTNVFRVVDEEFVLNEFPGIVSLHDNSIYSLDLLDIKFTVNTNYVLEFYKKDKKEISYRHLVSQEVRDNFFYCSKMEFVEKYKNEYGFNDGFDFKICDFDPNSFVFHDNEIV